MWDGGASMQHVLYPAALQVGKSKWRAGSRPRTAYVYSHGRLTQGWDQVARQHAGDRRPRRRHAHHQQRRWGSLSHLALAKGTHGVRLQLAYIGDDFDAASFCRSSIASTWWCLPSNMGARQARSGDPCAAHLFPGL